MADPRGEEIRNLVSSPESQRRLFGFLRLEERLHELPDQDILRLLDQAEADSDPRIQQIGRRLGVAFRELRRARLFPEGGRSVLEIGEALEPHEADTLGTTLPQVFRDAVEVLLGACLDRLQEQLVSGSPTRVRQAVLTAGEIRHARFLNYFEELAGTADHALEVVQALTGWNRDRGRELLRELASGGSSARIPALGVLAREKDPEAYGLLELASADPSAEVRAAAAGGLGCLTDDKSKEVLRRMLDDREVSVQVAAIDAWARHQDPAAVAVLLDMLQHRAEDPRLKAGILACLRDLRSPAAQEVLLQLVRDSDDRVRANAIEALTCYEYSFQKALRLFKPLLKDPAARVRGNAILALFLVHPPTATEALVELFDSSEAPFRRAAAYGAGMMQSKQATEKLALLMRTEQDHEVLQTGIRALSKIRGPDAIRILRDFAERSYGEICIRAVNLLAELGDANAVPTLVKLARESEEFRLRAAAVQAIGQLAGDQGVNYLPRFLGDKDHRVVANAIEGLEQSGNLEAIPLLTPLLQSPNPRIRGSACTALWHLGEFSALKVLGEMLRAEDEAMVSAGLQALGRLGHSLRVGELGERPVLRLALTEAYRRSFPGSLQAGDAREAAAAEALSLDASRVDLTETGAHLREDVSGLFAPEVPPGEGSPPREEDPGGGGPPAEAAPAAGSEASPPSSVPGSDDEAGSVLALEWLTRTLEAEGPDLAELLAATRAHRESPALLHLALSRALRDQDPGALAELTSLAAAGDVAFLAPLYTLARESRRSRDMAAAMTFYFRIARVQLEELGSLLEAGEAALAGRDLETAGQAARLLPTMLHFLPRFHALMGDFYLSCRRYPEARDHLLRAVVCFPEEPLLALKLASTALRLGAPSLARSAASLAASRDPDGEVGTKARALLAKLPPEAPANGPGGSP